MDLTAFFAASYGLYIVSTEYEGNKTGCIINTFCQVTNTPNQVTISINKGNFTTELIEKRGAFAIVALTEQTSMNTIAKFGFQCGRDVEKFDEGYALDKQGLPYITENVAAEFSCKVVNSVELGTHMLFIAEVVDAFNISKDAPMTYSYYHKVKKGTTPPKAASYQAEAEPVAKGWRCKICGYIYEGEALPTDFKCPVCGKDASYFEKL